MYLQIAGLFYGGPKMYEVKADDVSNLPTEFDFAKPEQCAVKVLRALSQASGGHSLRDCHVLVHKARHTATVSASGAIARYAPRGERTKLTADEAIRILNETQRIVLGTVYPNGARR